jgi:hypothetical protein
MQKWFMAPGLIALSLFVLPPILLSAEEKAGKETGRSSVYEFNATTSGFLGSCLLEIDNLPAACFGLEKQEGGKARYTYLLLFKVDPKNEDGSGTGGSVAGSTGTDGGRDVKLEVEAMAAGKKVAVSYKLKTEANTGKVLEESLTVDGNEYGKDGPRVFLVDLTAEKTTCVPVKGFVPAAVPDFAAQDQWAAQILKAIAELKEKSTEAKTFFGGK